MVARRLTRGIAVAFAFVAGVPVAAALTLVIWPAWGWFETRTGIESLGHSGPADWCFVATLLACWSIGGVLAWRGTRGDGDATRRRQ
jgi:hypothetical protein